MLALVALGTADQIALLEMTRGLRDCNITPRIVQNTVRSASQNGNESDVVIRGRQDADQRFQSFQCNNRQDQDSRNLLREVESDFQNFHSEERNNYDTENRKTQESQTEITTVEDVKSRNVPSTQSQSQTETSGSQSSVLHALVDHLAHALNVPKSTGHPLTETQTIQSNDQKISDIIEHVDSDPLSNNSISSSESSPRENYDMPTEIYRSVGVGAEFDETANQLPSTSYQSSNAKQSMKEKSITSYELGNELAHVNDEPSFRAHVEIECALHLPKVEKPEGLLEPSTYVTFQPVQKDNGNQLGPYKVTNIYPNSCSPKWEWRCDTRLSSDLLINVNIIFNYYLANQ